MNHYSDKELLEQFNNGNADYAFNLIVRKYQQKIYSHVRHLVIDHDDADDLTQTTFIKAWKALGNFRADAQLYTWLYRIATNECYTFLKNKRKRFFIPIHDVEAELTEKLEHVPSLKANELELQLQKAILSLPEKQRVVFTLRYYDEMKYEDMSEVLGTSVGALKASYHHAVQKIEKFLQSF
ncbi:MAG TPA: sigma-70 family RNA polymerase sigma factor [Bacteroidia bacterium]|nr:sigma-70 family RNA polymerase sigma factor [Bacteroidia bacterium]HMU18435.1 sigma-70 family RNA polymerase sigma factor [Bacteroidia bacterium]